MHAVTFSLHFWPFSSLHTPLRPLPPPAQPTPDVQGQRKPNHRQSLGLFPQSESETPPVSLAACVSIAAAITLNHRSVRETH